MRNVQAVVVVFGVVGLRRVDNDQTRSLERARWSHFQQSKAVPSEYLNEVSDPVHLGHTFNDLKLYVVVSDPVLVDHTFNDLKLYVVVSDPVHVGHTFNDLKLYVVVSDPVHVGHTFNDRLRPRSRWPYFQRSLRMSPWPFPRNSFKKPRLSQIVQIQSNLQKSIALEMQTSCSFIKSKMSIPFF